MKRILKISCIFLGGAIVGAILMNLLHMYVRPTYRQLIRTNLKAEEEYMAGRSRRENRPLETAFHRWAALNAEAEDGFRTFRRNNHEMDDPSFFSPFELLSLKWLFPPDKFQKGREISEGISRGKFAAALDAIRETGEATAQWQLAQQMTRLKDMAETKKLIYDVLEQDKTDIHMQAEKKILGETDRAQQKNRGDR